MKWSKHLKIAGALQIVQSLTLIPGTGSYIIWCFRDIHESPPAFALFIILIIALVLFIGVCQLLFGISLIMQKRWTTRRWGLICCAPGLISFPMLFSAYTLWVLIMVRGEDAKVTESGNGELREKRAKVNR
jgi:hypothetical protein